ncbi:S9 family peptidase [Hyphobacterium sp. CCMP332]|nr:S9 family peptidase [Hyphobacterium sp. CCMP332]
MRKLQSIILFLLITHFAFAQDRLNPELLWEMDRVYGVEVSPDQKSMIYSSRSYDLAADKGKTVIYIYDFTSGSRSKIIDGGDVSISNAIWRPDGKKIGFIKSGVVFEANPDGSSEKQITFFDAAVSNFAYAPDLKHISFSKEVKLGKTLVEKYPDVPRSEAMIFDNLMYRHWTVWQDEYFSHVHFAPYSDSISNSSMVDIMPGEKWDTPMPPFGGAEEITWSPDGKNIVYVSKKLIGKDWAVSTNSDLYQYNLASAKTKNLTEGMMGYDKSPKFSKDGKKLAWLSMARDGYESDQNVVYTMDVSTGNKVALTKKMDETVDDFIWSDDGKTIYFLAPINATYQYFELQVPASLGKSEISKEAIRQITNGDHNYRSLALAGKNLVGIKQTMSMASEVYQAEIKSGKDKALTMANMDIYERIKMGKVEKRFVKTSDGKDMLTWVIYPPDFDPKKKYPALLYCQGGPQSPVSQFFSFRWNFQLMAANDYIIVAPNRRGLPSFGTEWNEQISGDWGGQAMKDYLAAIDDVAKEDYVDENRLGAIGASYGGYSVYYLAGIHEDRFKTFISHCGLFNLESWYASTEEMFFANWDIGGPYWQDEFKEEYKKHSPHRYVENWNTPIMVIHGALDFRVPLNQGMEAFQVAQLKGIPSKFLYFPDEGHWVLKPQNGLVWHREFFSWLDKWLK